MIAEARYTCKYCRHIFVQERRYLVHECKQMKKEAELKTPSGQSAWHYYQLWFRQQKKMPPPASTFLTSNYFRTFINFVKFTQKVSLPRPDKFIWLMVHKKYMPTIWTNDQIYVEYIEYLDRQLAPMEQTKISIETLLTYAEQKHVDVSHVFDVLSPNDLIQMVRVRTMSPWLLLQSDKFKAFFKNTMSPEQKIILGALIQPSYWEHKMAKCPEEIKDIKKCVDGLNI